MLLALGKCCLWERVGRGEAPLPPTPHFSCCFPAWGQSWGSWGWSNQSCLQAFLEESLARFFVFILKMFFHSIWDLCHFLPQRGRSPEWTWVGFWPIIQGDFKSGGSDGDGGGCHLDWHKSLLAQRSNFHFAVFNSKINYVNYREMNSPCEKLNQNPLDKIKGHLDQDTPPPQRGNSYYRKMYTPLVLFLFVNIHVNVCMSPQKI